MQRQQQHAKAAAHAAAYDSNSIMQRQQQHAKAAAHAGAYRSNSIMQRQQQQRAKAAAHQHMQSVKDFVLAGSQQQMLNAPCTTLAFASHAGYRQA